MVNRQPEGCTPDWYGDTTSFMGSGPDLQLPNAMKYRVSGHQGHFKGVRPRGGQGSFG